MKKSIYVFPWFFLVCINLILAQQLTIGDQLDSTIALFDVRNAQAYELKRDTGKMILLDFWATWCAPCIANMPHLESLQEKFKEELSVIPICLEDEDRIKKFISKRPYKLNFSLDTQSELRSLFPFRIIPHAVLIDPQGKVLAITDPKNITEEVIANYLKGEKIHLPTKLDRVDFDLINDDLFELSLDINESFSVLGEFEGLPSFQKITTDGYYKDRRVTFINQSIRGMYQYVYDKGWRRFQLIDEDRRLLEEDVFSVDLVIENPSELELKVSLLEKLKKQFGLVVDTVSVEREVILLYIEDVNKLPKRSGQWFSYIASGDHFKSQGASIANFASYLEVFGIVGGIVTCDQCVEEFFEIDFQFKPENPDSFWESLKKIGLNLKKTTRAVDMISMRVLH